MAYRFNGTSAYQQIPTTLTTYAPTFFCRVFVTAFPSGSQTLIGLTSSGSDNHRFDLRLLSTGLVASAAKTTSGEALSTAGPTIRRGAWNSIAGTFQASDQRKHWVNGYAGTDSTGARSVAVVTPELTLGRLNLVTPIQYFSGLMEDVAIWNVVLRPNDLLALERGVSPLNIKSSNLVHYASLRENSPGLVDLRKGGVQVTNSAATRDRGIFYDNKKKFDLLSWFKPSAAGATPKPPSGLYLLGVGS